MTVFPEQEIRPTIPVAINRTFDSLNDDWCYENTRFMVYQLCLIHSYLDLPPSFIRDGRTHCSSEEGFIVMMVKLATGFAKTKLCHMFGELRGQRISDIYRFTIGLLDVKAESFVHGPDCMEQLVEYFPDFAAMIERKLSDEEYGRLLFDNLRIIGFVDCKIV
jgi:hypothetical protein